MYRPSAGVNTFILLVFGFILKGEVENPRGADDHHFARWTVCVIVFLLLSSFGFGIRQC
jgi:hypothetical protein